ncbi:hypothetical protein CROQUDRAFT_88419 [Cronartium quercuum f. sp. fusiforme G11]|uniref:Uncharacterized protein n=1 Tax=Cronartium quercuum f. sp. fusiforme G11 TaxID=708437 RepID=A0A9P6NTP9_9BASI|nr:hypothetical protein CROQUDRAFT_88419 [Cronartium quercuum f. sp. fusiforme G11]
MSLLLTSLGLIPLFILSVLSLPSQPQLAHRSYHYANLSSPVPGQVLFPGRPFRLTFSNGATTATSTQISIFNSTGLYVIKTGLPFSHHKTDIRVILPEWVAHGTYDFVFAENNGSGEEDYEDVVVLTIYVGRRPPAGIGSGAKEDETMMLQQSEQQMIDQEPWPRLVRREPHPARFLSPSSSQSFSAGSDLPIHFRDGETTASLVQFVLRDAAGNVHKLGLVPFTSFQAQRTFQIPNNLPEGHYKILALENSDDAKDTFTNALELNIQLSKPNSAQRRQITQKVVESTTASLLERRTRRTSVKMTESPSIILPEVAKDVPMGSTVECMIHDRLATTETVQFVLRGTEGAEHYLGQANFKDHFAGGNFSVPSAIRADSYTVVARENSVGRPKKFLEVVTTYIFVTSQTGTQTTGQVSFQAVDSSKGQAEASSAPSIPISGSDSDSALEKVLANYQDNSNVLVRREPHLPQIISPVYGQVIPPAAQFHCALLDGQVTDEAAKFVLRHESDNHEYNLGQASFNSSLAKRTCFIPTELVPGTYRFVAQENTTSDPENYIDVASVQISVADPNNPSQNKGHPKVVPRAPMILRAREPHPVTLISPVSFQNITPGEAFDCNLKDGETTATLVKYLLRNKDENDTTLGQTSFSNYQAQGKFQCPKNLPLGSYTFVVQENSSADPEDFEDSVKVPVNVVAKTLNVSSSSSVL